MITVGVLGAGGFVGSRIVEMLHLSGRVRVVPIVRLPEKLARPARFDLDWRLANATDREALTQAFAGCDVVVTAVAGRHQQIRIEPTTIYPAAEAAGVKRLVYTSTASVHGQNPAPGTHDDSPLSTKQSFAYNNEKARAEMRLRALRAKGRTEIVILRPCIVLGPRDQWISGMARAMREGTAALVDGGLGICNSSYIENYVHAVELALTAPVDGEAFIIVDDETITWREIYDYVSHALFGETRYRDLVGPTEIPFRVNRLDELRWSRAWRGVKPFLPAGASSRLLREVTRGLQALAAGRRAWREAEAGPLDHLIAPPTTVTAEKADLERCGYKLPNEKARKLLGYRPIVPLATGLERTIEWLRWIDYEKPTPAEEPRIKEKEPDPALTMAQRAAH